MAKDFLNHRVIRYRLTYFDADWNELEALTDVWMSFDDCLVLVRKWQENREWLRRNTTEMPCLMSQATYVSIEEYPGNGT